MIKLNREMLSDKVYACWIGKNIGGTLGGPYEGKRQVLNVEGFSTKAGEPLPNDDLDLQIVWLRAMRHLGPQGVNERSLGEYWMEYISPYWNEYGICKANMTHGLPAPMSGHYKNEWKHSNGAWIRTEIWACLYPADVNNAVKYAYYDACVDHGSGDGTHAAMFVAALESAAFVISDIRELINIGLSKIPADCRFAKYINTAVECYDSGKTWLEARNILTDMALSDEELGWFQAPTNVGYAVIGLLYGEGDFKKTMLTAINCGDDTDCTAATVGSIMGIKDGMAGIPSDWREYIGDKIVTLSINRGAFYNCPATCTQLSEEVIRTRDLTLWESPVVKVVDTETELPEEDKARFLGSEFAKELGNRSPYHVAYEFPMASVTLEYDRAPDIKAGEQIKIKVHVKRKLEAQKHYVAKLYLPEGWTYEGNPNFACTHRVYRQGWANEFIITAGERVDYKNRGVLELSIEGRAEVELIPLVFFGE